MPRKSLAPPNVHVESSAARRIIATARKEFFMHGVRRVTMDDLARELQMSKKTLYACFPDKRTLMEAVIRDKFQEMRADLGEVLSKQRVDFLASLRQLLVCLQSHAAEIQPPWVRDLRSLDTEVFRLVETERQDVIQTYFGRFFAQGQRTGMIRKDIPAGMIVEILLAAVNEILNPQRVAALGITVHSGVSAIISVILEGVVSEKARAKR